MKRTLIAAAAVLAAGTAFAQSSVTIYGRVNTTVERQKDSAGTKTVVANNASRWGLRGSEDLGGGMKALFVLESGFNSDDGSASQGAGALFRRESWVGLQGNFGRVRLGNLAPTAAYYATADYISMHNHDTGSSEDALYRYFGGNAGPRLNNAIAYNTPSFGGLVVEGQFALKETTVGGKNTAVLAANYDRGPLHLGAGFINGPGSLVVGNTVYGGIASDGKEYGLRALYELGAFTVGAYYVRNEVDTGTLKAKRDAYRLSGMYTFGSSELHLNVGFADKIKVGGAKQAGSDALQYTVGYNYNLSKRTKLYAYYTRIDNKIAASYGGASANGEFGTVNPGFDPSSVAVGIRHNF